jgi:hypothetical protein
MLPLFQCIKYEMLNNVYISYKEVVFKIDIYNEINQEIKTDRFIPDILEVHRMPHLVEPADHP